MRDKKQETGSEVTDQITTILTNRPVVADRILSILKIANERLDCGRIRSADEVESMLVEELRQLGNESLSGWADGADEHASGIFKADNPKGQLREKKR